MNGEEVPIVTGNVGLKVLDSDAASVIGRREDIHPVTQLGASLDEFKIYDRVLTAEEALQHYLPIIPEPTTGLLLAAGLAGLAAAGRRRRLH